MRHGSVRAGASVEPELPKYRNIVVDEITLPSWGLVGEVNAVSGSTGTLIVLPTDDRGGV